METLVKFHINGILVYSDSDTITYERICKITNLNPDNNPTIVISYRNQDLKDRCIMHNQVVAIFDGCIINAGYTGNA